MKKFPILFVCLVMAYATGARERTFTVASPDMTNEVTVRQTDSGFMMQINPLPVKNCLKNSRNLFLRNRI